MTSDLLSLRLYQEVDRLWCEQGPACICAEALLPVFAKVLEDGLPKQSIAPAGAAVCDSSPFGNRRKVPPQPEWVEAYSASIGYPLDGAAWCDCYAAKGWSVGKKKMVDWQAAVRNWKTNDYAPDRMKKLGGKSAGTGKDYSKF